MRYFLASLFCASSLLAQVPSQMSLPKAVALTTSASSGSTIPDTTGMVMWEDVNYGVTNTANVTPPSGTLNVQGWRDLSSNNFPLLEMGGVTRAIPYATTGNNTNGPCIDFSTANASSALTNKTGGSSFSQPNAIIMVYKLISTTAGCLINSYAGQEQQVNYQITGMHMFAGTTDRTIGSLPQDGNWVVETWIFDGASTRVRQNGSVVSTIASPGTSSVPGITLGNFFNLTSLCQFKITQFVWLSGATGVGNVHAWEQYLGTENGITVP